MLLIMVNFDLFATRSLAVIEPDLRDHRPVAAPLISSFSEELVVTGVS